MNLLTRALSLFKARTPGPVVPYLPQMAAATFYPGEDVRRFAANPNDVATTARCLVQTLWLFVTMNARACAGQRIRVLRPKGGGRKHWRGRDAGRKMHRYLRGDGPTLPSAKAMGWADQADEVEEVTEGPAVELIRNPDPFTSAGDFWISLYWSLESVGKGLLYSPPEQRIGNAPVSLYGLMPQYSRLQPSRTNLFAGVWYGRSRADEFFVDAEDLIYLRHQPHPNNPIDGISWPQSVQLAADAENAAMTAEVARWCNGGQPGMVLKLAPGTTEPQAKQATAAVASQIRGVNKAGGFLTLVDAELIIGGGAKPHEMNYTQGLAEALSKMRMAAGVPEAYVKMGSSSLASAWRADPQYMGETIQPRIDKVGAELTEAFRARGLLTDDEWIQYDCPVAEDDAATEKRVVSFVGMGVMTPNEGRTEIGYEPAEDEYADARCINGVPVAQLVDSSMASAEAARRPPPALTQDGGAGGGGGQTGDERGGSADRARPERTDADREGDGDKARPNDGAASAKSLRAPVTGKADLSRELEGELKAMEARLRRLIGANYRVNDAGEPSLAEFQQQLGALMERALPALMESAGRDALEALSIDQSFAVSANPAALEFARTRGAELVTSVTETMKASLRATVAEGVDRGQTLTEIQNNIRAQAPEFSAARAEVIARTETSFATNEGERLAWKGAGVEKKQWLLAGGPCPICEDIAAKNPGPVPIDQDFEGSQVKAPPAHPNCRCTIVPVIAESGA